MKHPDPHRDTTSPSAAESSSANCEDLQQKPPSRIRSETLFRGARQIVIEHGTEEYRLRLTRQDRLILTK